MTDFGEDDFFAASMKAVIFGINPDVHIVDITHRIPSYHIHLAGFVLFSAYKYFPSHTIFVVVVDPGVGSERRVLLAETKKYFFIGPDNGVLSLSLWSEEICQIRELNNDTYFLEKKSRTFEGRDKMAPAAAWLSRGVPVCEFGPRVSRFKEMEIREPRVERDEIFGRIVYIDKFGNLITNITEEMIDRIEAGRGKEALALRIGDKAEARFRPTYAQAEKGEVFFLIGSLGLIEVAAKEDSAAAKVPAGIGQEVKVSRRTKV